LVSMFLGFVGYMFIALALLAVMMVWMAHSTLSASGVDMTSAFGFIDDEDEEEKVQDDVGKIDSEAPVSAAVVAAGSHAESADIHVVEKSCARHIPALAMQSPATHELESEPISAPEGKDTSLSPCRVQVSSMRGIGARTTVTTSGQPGSFSQGLASALDAAVVLLTGVALVSMWLGCTRQLNVAVPLLVIAMFTVAVRDVHCAKAMSEEEAGIIHQINGGDFIGAPLGSEVSTTKIEFA